MRLVLLLTALLQILAIVILHRTPAPANPALADAWLHRLDQNGDGILTEAEAAAQSLPGMPSWDLDADGRIEGAELEAMLWALDPGALYSTASSRR